MAATMQAYRLHGDGSDPGWETVPVPEVPTGGVLLRVDAVGLCHSDIAMMGMDGRLMAGLGWRFPFTLGHEIAGTVAAVDGLAVGAAGVRLRVGDRVLVATGVRCGRCWFCRRDEDHNCEEAGAGIGYGRDGGLADLLAVGDPTALIDIGDLDPIAAAPLSDAAATSHHAVERVLPKLDAGSRLVLIGCGGLGSHALQIVRSLGRAEVIVVDVDPAKRDLARRLGAARAVADLDVVTAELRSGERRGVDAVLDFVGTDDTIRTGLAAVRPGGTFGLVGAEGGSFESRMGWYHELPRDGEVFTFQGSSRHDVTRVLDLARRGVFETPVDVFARTEVDRAYERLRAGDLPGRAVVDLRRGADLGGRTVP